MSRFAALLVCLLAALCLPSQAGAAVAGHVRDATDNAARTPSGTGARNGVVVLKSGQTSQLRQLKAENPRVKVLLYKELAFTSSSWSDNTAWSAAGVSYTDALANGWILKDTSGHEVTSGGWGYLTGVDVGSAGYQQRWTRNVVSELRSDGWDGVFMDDVNPTLSYHTDPSQVARYPNDAAYQRAMSSALAYIAPRLHGAGKLALGNVGGWPDYRTVTSGWLSRLDGAMWEHFAKADPGSSASGYATGATWERNLRLVKDSERTGKLFLGITRAPDGDRAAARYGWATMLLGAAGHSYFAACRDWTRENWFDEYDYDIGDPVGAESADAGGVHRRLFTNGLVLVNPTDASRSVQFGGSYSGSGLSNARSGMIPAHSGLVLHGRSREPRLTRGRKPISLLAGTGAGSRVTLTWAHGRLRGKRRVRRYMIYRDGRLVAVTRRRRFTDRAVVAGSRARYRVAGADRRGRIRAVSRPARVRVVGAQVAASGHPLVRVALAAERRGLWRRAFVQRRIRRGGHAKWVRASRVKRPRAGVSFRVRGGRRATLRIVVRSSRRLHRALYSARFRPAG
ncbi:MAG: putative glycoside hydrolase [Thermoleophilaceae bacterium]